EDGDGVTLCGGDCADSPTGCGSECFPSNPSDDDCDGWDNDCDSQTDEDYVPRSTVCGVGSCVANGMTACVSGVESDSCTPGTPGANDATCDGIDNNCNDVTDENYDPRATTCGVGACGSTGITSCIGGVESDSCTPGSPATDDTTCDGVDDDCDTMIDEDCEEGNRGGTEGGCECSSSQVEVTPVLGLVVVAWGHARRRRGRHGGVSAGG
ncbi:MopE-related protein, partial [Myxococcota bacterium]